MAPDQTAENDAAQAVPVDVDTSVDVDATPEAEAALRRARAMSSLLDDSIRVPGTDFRIGLDPILGVVPGSGDAVAAALALYPVIEAYRLDAPKRMLATMLTFVVLDFAVGLVPILGGIVDAVWKANKRNVRALERHVEGA